LRCPQAIVTTRTFGEGHVPTVAQRYDSFATVANVPAATVPPVGFEPTRLSAMVFETTAYADSATGAIPEAVTQSTS
jgi:hypothetical protein